MKVCIGPVALVFVVLLSGCQEIQGPTWSGDGQWIAYTVYAHKPGGGLQSSVYICSPDGEDPNPKLLAADAAFPQFSADGSQLFFLGNRDTQGFFTKIWRATPGKGEPEIALGGLRLNAMQLATSNAGPLLLLLAGRDSKPGAQVSAELWSATDNKRIDLHALGDMSGPAISFNGRVLVYGMKPAEGHPILMAAEFSAGTEAKAVFPTATLTEPDALSFVVQPFPSSDRFLFYGPGLKNVWVMSGKPGANKFTKFQIPDGLSCPIMARVADDSSSAALTFIHATPGKLTYEAYRLDLLQGRWTKLDESPDELIGGLALDPKSKKGETVRRAWLSAAGLTISDVAKPVWLPVTAGQHLAASALLLAANQPDKALEMALKAQELNPAPNAEALNRALYAAYLGNKKFDRATDIFEQSWLLSPVGQDGIHFMFPPESGLPPPAPEWVAAQTRSMDELIIGAPENRMIPLLKLAFVARLKGQHRDALDAYRKAIDYCPDRARVGGVRFLQGICELELGEAYQAGEMFEQAARIDDFPQADLAAGMGAMAYLLHGRKESTAKAAVLLQLPAAKKSAWAAELNQIPTQLKGKTFKEHGATPEAIAPDDSAHAWAEYDTYWMPVVATKSMLFDAAGGKTALRHFGVKRLTASSIYTNKQATPILRVARAVTTPKLSPTGNALAFTVNGEVVPVADNFCELIVLDLTGGTYNGNTQAAAAGLTRGHQILTQFAWKGSNEISISGVDVDIFGAQKAFERTVPLGRLVAKKP